MSAAAIILIRRKRLLKRFREAGATDPDHAVTLEALSERPSWIFKQMNRHGVFVAVKDGRFYMDERVAAEFRRHQRNRAFIIGGVLVLVFLALWIFGFLR